MYHNISPNEVENNVSSPHYYYDSSYKHTSNINNTNNYFSQQPEAAINTKIQQQEGIRSNWEYRKYLQNNAQNIMKINYMESVNASGNNPKAYNSSPGQAVSSSSTNTPFVFLSTHDKRTPKYGYNESDLKNDYITKYQLNTRMIAPSISTKF